MKRTVLTQTQLNILEEALLRFGLVVTIDDLAELMSDKRPGYRRKIVKSLVDSGWLVRIKRGVYQIADMSSLGTLSLSRLAVAQILLPDSYVSFEAALQHWGMYDQLLAGIGSVSRQPYYGPDQVDGVRYVFVKTTDVYFYGWQTVEIDQQHVQVATAEKALIDMVQFHRSTLSLSIVREKLETYSHQIDFDQLVHFLLRANLTTQRIFGHLFDQIGWDTTSLHSQLPSSSSVSRMTPSSGIFDARWRLYYDAQNGELSAERVPTLSTPAESRP
jgi:predicted transcriptional regulator of viral defense system